LTYLAEIAIVSLLDAERCTAAREGGHREPPQEADAAPTFTLAARRSFRGVVL
jgi:hypothetical protein